MGQEERAFRPGLLKGSNPTMASAVLEPKAAFFPVSCLVAQVHHPPWEHQVPLAPRLP